MRAAATLPVSPEERLSELAEILAAGLMRVATRKSSELCDLSGESSLHMLPDQSGHPASSSRRTSDG
jgi:hypothetical protein